MSENTGNNELATDPQAAMLIRVQAELLRSGYKYCAGEEESWPLSPVIMTRGSDFIFIATWTAERHDELLRQCADFLKIYRAKTGFLLVGMARLNAPAIQDLFARLKWAVAYIDESEYTFRLGWPLWIPSLPSLHNKTSLTSLLSFTRFSYDYGTTDRCLAALHEQLPEANALHRFHEESMRVRDDRNMPITLTLFLLCTLCFIGTLLTGFNEKGISPTLSSVVMWGALHGPHIRDGQWWRLFSYAFLHGGIMHYLF